MNAIRAELEVLQEKQTHSEDVAALEQIWQKLDTQIRQTEFNLRRLIEQKVKVEGEIVTMRGGA